MLKPLSKRSSQSLISAIESKNWSEVEELINAHTEFSEIELACRKIGLHASNGNWFRAQEALDHLQIEVARPPEAVDLDTPVQLLFCTRTSNALELFGYPIVSALLSAAPDDLYDIPNVGDRVIEEVTSKMFSIGYESWAKKWSLYERFNGDESESYDNAGLVPDRLDAALV